MTDARKRAAALECWSGKVDPQPISGGITNQNFITEDGSARFFVRIGDDIPMHGIMRFNEAAASRAAAAAGVSPEVVHLEPGALVLRFIDGRTYTEADVQKPENLTRVLSLVRKAHGEIPRHFRGPAMVFWVFQVVRDYASTLREGGSRMRDQLPRLLEISGKLERAVGPIELIFGHNDLLAANFIDDGQRLWLVDWDYAGFNSALFDLGGLASNNQLSPEQEDWLLESYFETPVTDELRRRYTAMKCASLLRESMWSMVQEIHSPLDFDYRGYTAENLSRFERAWKAFSENDT